MAEFAIVGAGPVGSIIAAHLADAGERVHLVELSGATRAAIEREGIRIEGTRELSLPPTALGSVVSAVEELADIPLEALFLCVKATALPLVCSALSESLIPGATIVSWQNGIDTERIIADHLGADHTVRAVVNYGVSRTSESGIRMQFEHPPHYVQEVVPEGRERAEAIARTLSGAGLATERADQLVAMVWRKAILNAALNALCGLTGLNMEEVTRDSYAWNLADSILKEGIAVARANEVWVGHEFYRWAESYLKSAGPHRPSMLADLENGRRTEIDFINGKIVEYGTQAGIETPYNRAMLALVKARERHLHER